ncbi:MAG: ATP-binding protein, partial [bacterium]
LADMRSDGNILPFPTMTVQKKTVGGCELAIVEVLPSYNPPVRYNGRVWIRVGPRRAQATAEEERRLTEKLRAGDLPFDQHPVIGATLEDLDLELFKQAYLPAAVAGDILAENQRTVEQQFASLRFLNRQGVPNIASIIVFGKRPTHWIPGAYVQFLRLDGSELTDPIRHQKEIVGPLPELIRQLDEVLDANISINSDVRNGPTEQKEADYPIVALQQLTRNAVLHRTYESTHAPSRIYWFTNRIEIISPGGLYGLVNADNFGQPGATDYRNPLLAEATKVLGFVQRFGIGIPLARKELEKNGNPESEFKFESTKVVVVIWRKK